MVRAEVDHPRGRPSGRVVGNVARPPVVAPGVAAVRDEGTPASSTSDARTGRTHLEQRLDLRARALLERLPSRGRPGALVEFLAFGLKQAWACLFGGALLALLLLTSLWWPDDAPVARYDALVVSAVGIQAALLTLRMETWAEARVVLVFHVAGTVMELFKTAAGSWTYPEDSLLRIADVPLFSGFMYAAVGSYLARVWRLFDFRFERYPPFWATAAVAVAVYVNFFAHHVLPDARWVLLALVGLLWWPTTVRYRVWRHRLGMPLLVGFGLVALFIWLAENLATFARAWTYPDQADGWQLVGPDKYVSWYLLMIVSFVLVTAVHRRRRPSPSSASRVMTSPTSASHGLPLPDRPDQPSEPEPATTRQALPSPSRRPS